jgi:hypothetical protein
LDLPKRISDQLKEGASMYKTIISIMATPVVEFSREGCKIRKLFG